MQSCVQILRGLGYGSGDPGGLGRGLQNTGPGGGGYGGRGGSGAGLSGGDTYGSETDEDIEMGSNGGPFLIEEALVDAACEDLFGLDSEGGSGGGCVGLEAGEIHVWGYVQADGQAGEHGVDGSTPDIVDGGGGGSGGGISLSARRVELAAGSILSAQGARGGQGGTYDPGTGGGVCIGNGGGGGGGGRIKIFGDNVVSDGSIAVSGGSGGTGPQSDATGGTRGTSYVE